MAGSPRRTVLGKFQAEVWASELGFYSDKMGLLT